MLFTTTLTEAQFTRLKQIQAHVGAKDLQTATVTAIMAFNLEAPSTVTGAASVGGASTIGGATLAGAASVPAAAPLEQKTTIAGASSIGGASSIPGARVATD